MLLVSMFEAVTLKYAAVKIELLKTIETIQTKT